MRKMKIMIFINLREEKNKFKKKEEIKYKNVILLENTH